MVFHKYKTIFVHIPKAAGQSVEAYFLGLEDLSWSERLPLLLTPNDEPSIGPPRLAHLQLQEYLDNHYVSEELFYQYYKFGFVRNPWSRTVSFYKFHGHHHLMSFERFVDKALPKLIKTEGWFYGPQYDFFYRDGVNQADFIGKFESLQDDFKTVCAALDIPATGLPHRNKSAEKGGLAGLKKFGNRFLHRPQTLPALLFRKGDTVKSKNFREYYTPELVSKVQALYPKDVEVFGYSFE